jgi:hypothetical protein
MKLHHTPSGADVQEALSRCTFKQIVMLSFLSGVPETTLFKLRAGEIANPGVETVRRFAAHIAKAKRSA